ncbi:hypothetical protein ACIRVK_45165 [Streptomyces sp. NPDC101152]|uniref:hypothetical protein n=1 Tax=Streptomyces sp. NPDC101152 TaxID=3366116 RepID=UPI00380CEE15
MIRAASASTARAAGASRSCIPIQPDDIDVLRQDLAAQLDEEFRTVATVQAAAFDPKIKLTASAQLVKINESYRKLFAVDSPTPLEAALTTRAELEADLIAASVEAAVKGVVEAADVDPAFASKLTVYAFELAARRMALAEGTDPGPEPEAPRPQLALTAGSAENPSGDIDEDGGPSVPHPRRRDSVDSIMAQARALLEEDDDDEGEETDQG